MKNKEILRKKSTKVNKRNYLAIAMLVVLLWTIALLPLGLKEEKSTSTSLSAGESKATTVVTQEILNDLGITNKDAFVFMTSRAKTNVNPVLGSSLNGVSLKVTPNGINNSENEYAFLYTINSNTGMNMYYLNSRVITLIERKQTGKAAEVLYLSDSEEANVGYYKHVASPITFEYYRIYAPTSLNNFKIDAAGYLYCNMPGKTGNFYFTYQTNSNSPLGLTPTRDDNKTVNLAEIELTQAYNKYYAASGQLRSCYSSANQTLLDTTYKTGLAAVKAETTLAAKKTQIATALAKLKAIVPQVLVIVDNASNSLSGLINGRSYTIGYEDTIISFTADNTGRIPLDGFSDGAQYDFAGKILEITLEGNDYQVDSTPENIEIPIRAEKPDGQGVADKNVSVGTDLISIIVSPANASEEYAVRNQSTGVISTWQTPENSGDTLVFSPLVDGIYEILVRSKGDETKLPSLPTVVGEPIKTIGGELAALKAELEAARAEANTKINENATLTAEDKLDLISKLNDKIAEARREIEKLALTGSIDSGQEILANAKLEIEKVTTEATLKAELEAARAETEILINGNVTLTDEDKLDLTSKLNDKITAARREIEELSLPGSTGDGQEILANAKLEIEKVTTEATLKAELEAARAEAETLINENATLTAEDKLDLINKLNDKITEARREIEELSLPESTGDGQAILANAKLEIEKVTTEAKLLERFKEKEKEIKEYVILENSGRPTKLSQESVAKAIANLEKAKQAQIALIQAATTKEELNTALNSSKIALDKSAAKGELEGCKDYWNSRLDGKTSELTISEIDNFKSFVEEKYQDALSKIDLATDTTALEGIVKVGNVEMYKETIIAQLLIDKKVALEKANLINSNVKNELIEAIDAAYETGKIAMLGVDATNSNSIANLLSTYSESALVINKLNAKAVIEKAVEDAIVSANKLFDPQKTAFLNEIETKRIAAYQEIEAITVQNGNINAVKNANALIINKLGFKAELLAYANAAKEQCEDFAEHAAPGGIEAAKNKIDVVYNNALADIEAGDLYNNAKQALDNGKNEIDKVIVELAKASAINEINSSAAKAKEEIDSLTDLPQDSKDAAKEAIDKNVSDAIINVNNQTELENIKIAKDLVLKDMQDQIINLNLDAQKDKATDEMTQVITQEKNKIDQMENLSALEKDKFKEALDKTLQDTKKAITDATTVEQINTAKGDMQESIDNIMFEAQKDVAKNILEQTANAEKDKIDQMENLSSPEKEKFKEDLDKTLRDTNKVIKDATTVEQINTAKGDMQESIDNIMFEAQKDVAKNILEQTANAEKEKIDQMENLSALEKDKFKEALDKTLQDTNKVIKDATTVEQINTAKGDMQESIDNIMFEAQKDVAKNILDKTANAEKDKIAALPGLTDIQKGSLNAEIDSALNEGKVQIDGLDKNSIPDEVKNVTNKIETIIKVAVKDLINDYASLIIEAISNSSLTPQEKLEATKAVNDKVIATELILDETLNSDALNIAIANAKNNLLEEYKKVAGNELSNYAKDYTTVNGNEGKYAPNYDADGKAQIELAVKTSKDDIAAATSIEDIKNALANSKLDIIAVAPKAPQVNLDYTNEQLTGLKPDTVYIINDGTKNHVLTTDDSGNVALKDSTYEFIGKTLTITQEAIKGIQADSKPQENINIHARPSGPADITLIISATGKGTLSGVTPSMEYSTDEGESWTSGTGEPISGIETGTTVLVRNKANDSSPASQNKEFTVLPRENIPNVTLDKAAETLAIEGSGKFTLTTTVGDVTKTIKITVENGKVIKTSDNGLKITPDGKIEILESWFGRDISIVKEAEANNTIDSNPQIIHILPRAETPSLTLDYINRVIQTGQSNTEFVVTVDGNEKVISSDVNGNIVIDSAWINKTLEIKQNGNGSSTSSSENVTVMVESYWIFTINYNGNGTSAISYSVKNGKTAPILEAPQRSQYEFIGWFKDAACTLEWDFKYDKVKEDTTIFAGWSKKHIAENEVVVTVVVEGKSKETITAVKNSFLKLDDPVLDGKTFAGWYLDSKFTYQYDFNSKLTGNITLYAKFGVTKIIITLPDKTIVNLNYGDKLDKPSDPSQDGYIFAGWYTDANCNNQLIFSGNKTKDGIKENITLFPKWVEKTHNVTGQITDENGNPLKNVEVTIESQPTKKTVNTDKNGNFIVTNVADGTYQVVAKYTDGANITIVTDIITIDGTDIKGVDIRLKGANLNSSVEIGNNAPNIVVGGLNGLFDNESIISQAEKAKAKINGNKVELKLVVERISANKLLDDFAKNYNKVIGASLDFTLYRVVTSAGEETKNYISTLDSVLKAVVPLSSEMQNKANYVIYRIHNGEIQEIHLGETNANEFGEYIELSKDKKSLVVYTKNFSSYSIAFDEALKEIKSNCYVHWIVLALIAIFIILVTTFTILFGKKCLFNMITWGVYSLSMLVLAFFVWHCTLDIILWTVGIVLAIVAVAGYLFYDKVFKQKA